MDFKEHEASVVVVGSFNPTIFQPEWFEKNQLISRPDLDSTNIELVHPDISRFDLPWCHVDVRQERFTLRCKDEAFFPMVRDLSIGVFKLLEHSPIKATGINSIITYHADSDEEWHNIGNTLVPKQIWKKYLSGHVGMTRVSVQAEHRGDELPGKINVTVVPVVGKAYRGIVIDINNHIELDSTERLTLILSEHWERLQGEAREMSDSLLMEAAQ